MENAISQIRAGMIQSTRVSHVPKHLSEGQALQSSSQVARFDTLELSDEGMSWAEDIKQSDPEMFVEWLKMNKENIEAGRPDLASLPAAFTMNDYHAYVKEPFSALV